MADARTHWPVELKVVQGGTRLDISFESGAVFSLSAEYLRVTSPSAEVQGHSRKERKTLGGKRNVKITGVEPVGSYAVKLSFDDGHATGIYTWTYLHELGESQDEMWGGYLADLETAGLDRDKAGEAQIHSRS